MMAIRIIHANGEITDVSVPMDETLDSFLVFIRRHDLIAEILSVSY